MMKQLGMSKQSELSRVRQFELWLFISMLSAKSEQSQKSKKKDFCTQNAFKFTLIYR